MKPCSLLRRLLLVGAVLALLGSVAAQAEEPLAIARQGYLFAGGQYSTIGDQQVMTGQLYAEFQIPRRQTHPYPVVMVHGGSQSGSNFTGTPDGREGWAQFFLRQGYAVYVVDQVGRGRAAYQPDAYGPVSPPSLDFTLKRFAAPERSLMWPQAHLHTQWPGKAVQGDPAFDQFFASQLPSIRDFGLQQKLNRAALVALLDKIGPAVLLTHSQSGSFGWPVADDRPNLVKAILAVEPSGPPVHDIENIGAPDWFRDVPETKPWGLGLTPLTYAPAVSDPKELSFVRQDKADAPDLARCWEQAAPARQLPNLQKMPILVITSEASYHAPYDHCTVHYLQQAGVHPTWIHLPDRGIRGNGHMMMLEKNNLAIAAVMTEWLGKAVPAGKAAKVP
jgi:pimeloyl-ACP methyl ester carboxylesterase